MSAIKVISRFMTTSNHYWYSTLRDFKERKNNILAALYPQFTPLKFSNLWWGGVFYQCWIKNLFAIWSSSLKFNLNEKYFMVKIIEEVEKLFISLRLYSTYFVSNLYKVHFYFANIECINNFHFMKFSHFTLISNRKLF